MMLVPRILVLIVIAGTKLLVFGADEYTVKTTETCYNNGDTAVIEVDYTDSNTVDFLQWKFSEMTIPADTLIIVASLCQTSAGQDAAFPTARMTYSCDNTNEDYTITISQFNENTDAGVWEVALSTNGAYTSYQSVTLSTCTTTTATSPPVPCEITVPWDIILLILAIIVAAADIIMIAYLLYLLYHAKAGTDGDGLSTSAIVGIVIGILVAVGIIVNIIVCVVTLEPTCSLSTYAILGSVIGSIDVVAIIAVIVYVIIKKTGDTDKGALELKSNGRTEDGSADKP